MSSARFVLQAVKGIQANMEYFATMIPLDCLAIFIDFSYFPQNCSTLETIGTVWFEDFNRYCSRLKTKAKKCELDGSIAYLLPTIFKSKLLFRLDLFSLSF